jgi:urea carboxylase-associated protein 1
MIAAGQPWAGIVPQGAILRIVDLEGQQGVDFLCYNAEQPLERYHAPNTLKASRSLRLTQGHTLYSDDARPMFTILADTCGFHDTIGGCCSTASNEMLYGVKNCPGCRENFLTALKPYGLGRKDIVPNINFFCDVPAGESGRLADTIFEDPPSKSGDYIDLRAEMEVLAVISNCPQINNPCNGPGPTPIEILVWRAH